MLLQKKLYVEDRPILYIRKQDVLLTAKQVAQPNIKIYFPYNPIIDNHKVKHIETFVSSETKDATDNTTIVNILDARFCIVTLYAKDDYYPVLADFPYMNFNVWRSSLTGNANRPGARMLPFNFQIDMRRSYIKVTNKFFFANDKKLVFNFHLTNK